MAPTTLRTRFHHGFPGPTAAALAFVLAPLLLIAGSALMMPFEQGSDEARQAALAAEPLRAEAAQNLYTAGMMLAGLAAIAFARLVAPASPAYAAWGGGLALAGSYLSAFWSGVMTFEVALAGLADRATAASVMEAAQPPLVMMLALPGLALGWPVLAAGARKAGVLSTPAALALALWVATPALVLSGTALLLPLPFVGMAVALVPLGLRLLRPDRDDAAAPRRLEVAPAPSRSKGD